MPTLIVMHKRESAIESFEVIELRADGDRRDVLVAANDTGRFDGKTSRFAANELIYMMGGDYRCLSFERQKSPDGGYVVRLQKKTI